MKHLKMVIVVAFILLMTSMAFSQVSAQYNTYEQFGPRVKNFIMKFYSNEDLEFSALEDGEIDLVEWPLTKTYYDKWQNPPYSDEIQIVGAGPEYGMYVLDINNYPVTPWNGTTYCPTSDPALRYAILHLIDREYIASSLFEGMAQPLYTPIPLAAPTWINPKCYPEGFEIAPGKVGTGELVIPYDEDAANQILDDAGYIDTDGDGFRNDPVTGDNLVLKFYIRSDHEYRRRFGEWLADKLENVTHIDVVPIFKDSYGCYIDVMTNGDFHLYTGGWGLGVDVPDSCFGLYHSSMYWKPGWSPNYAAYNDTISDELLEEAYYAASMSEAIPIIHQWQERFVSPEWAPSASIVSNVIFMAHRKQYGTWEGEEEFAGKAFEGFVNVPGSGIGAYDNGWTFMNVHLAEAGYKFNGSFNIRWGWKVSKTKKLNPLYGSWVWDWAIMGKIYESLIALNPFVVTEDKPWVAYQFSYGLWDNPDNPEFPKSSWVMFKIRDDIVWQDGEPFTMEDLRWMLEDIVPLCESTGNPYPWWYSSIMDVHHVEVIDDQTIKVYYNVRSYLTLHWVGGLPLVPKHIWQPLYETGDPTAHLADPNLIGCGPFKFVSYEEYAGAVLERNDNYFRLYPVEARITDWTYEETRVVRIILYNYALEPIDVTVDVSIGGTPYATKTVTVPAASGGGAYPGFYDWVLVDVPTGAIEVTKTFTYDGSSYTVGDYRANTLPEDINLDGFVNAKDAVVLGAAFGSQPGDLNWDARADIRRDGFVNAKDGVKLGAYFGWPNMIPIA